MVARKTKSTLARKLGTEFKKAFKEHKDDETVISTGGNLPKDIENGIAQLTEIKFDTYSSGDMEGEYYFLAAGRVVSPESAPNGQRILGLRTQIMRPLCETAGEYGKTVDEQVEWVLNQLRILGLDTSEITENELEEAAEALVEEAPCFAFRTWASDPTDQYPNPRVNHQWLQTVDFDVEDMEDDVEEEDEEEEDEDDIDVEALAKKADKGNKTAQKELTEWALGQGLDEDDIENADSWEDVLTLLEPDEDEEEEEIDDEDEEESLGQRADDGDSEALQELTEYAENAGLDPDDYETWLELEEALDEEDEEEDQEEDEELEDDEEEEEDEEPEKGQFVTYKPPRSRKYIDCEVTAVQTSRRTCNLREVSSKKLHKAVPFEKVKLDDVPF